MMKVELLRERERYSSNPTSCTSAPVTATLPFYRSLLTPRAYVHRVRSARLLEHFDTEWRQGRQQRTSSTPATRSLSTRLWCGQTGHVRLAVLNPRSVWARGRRGELLAEPPAGADVCATCEGRAVGAGYPSAILIAARPVLFMPRTEASA